MALNLDEEFLTSEEKEIGGVWLMIDEETGFLLRRFNSLNPKYKAAMSRHMIPLVRKIKENKLSPKEELAVGVKTFTEICLVDWKGVFIGGKEVPYSPQEAEKLFNRLPDLFRKCEDFAGSIENYREDLGNS